MQTSSKRRARPLELSRRTERALVTLGLLEDRVVDGELEVVPVREVEEALDCRFSDEILGLFSASHLDAIGREAGIALSEVVETTERARGQGLSDDWIAIGRLDDERFVSVPEEPDETTAELLVYDSADQGKTGLSVPRWLEDRIARVRQRLKEAGGEEAERADARPTDLQLATFRPTLSPERTRKRRVRHAKFGEGTVRDEQGSGESKKYRIEFEDEIRTILADYVEPIDE